MSRLSGTGADLVLLSQCAKETREIGVLVGRVARHGDVILLHGDLGTGKTTLAQGFGQGMGISEPVQSPTFTLVAEYDGRTPDGAPIRLYHLDLYRLGGTADLDSFGFDTYLEVGDGVTVIEWPERARDALPKGYLSIALEETGDSTRRLVIAAVPADGRYARHVAALR